MKRIETTYLGLKLKSPVVLSSSGMTATLDRICQAHQAGAGAVVLKSIFEEQILHEAAQIDQYSDYPEAADYISRYVSENSLGQYVHLIRDVKAECPSLPVIASIHCHRSGKWVNFAKTLEAAGADALELNIALLPTDKEIDGTVFEHHYLEIVEAVKAATSLPLAVKLGQGFTNPLAIVRELYYRGVKGVTLFNRFYPLDFDIESGRVKAGEIFSHPSELSNVLRWAGLVNAQLPLIDVAVSTGIHDGKGAVKALLAGAAAVEVASVVYEKGTAVIEQMNQFIREWMERHHHHTIADFAGSMNAERIGDTQAYERIQFMKYYSNHER